MKLSLLMKLVNTRILTFQHLQKIIQITNSRVKGFRKILNGIGHSRSSPRGLRLPELIRAMLSQVDTNSSVLRANVTQSVKHGGILKLKERWSTWDHCQYMATLLETSSISNVILTIDADTREAMIALNSPVWLVILAANLRIYINTNIFQNFQIIKMFLL